MREIADMPVATIVPRDYVLFWIIGLTMLTGIISLIALIFRVIAEEGGRSRSRSSKKRRRITLQRLHGPADARLEARRVAH